MKIRVTTNVPSRFGTSIQTSLFGELSFDKTGSCITDTELTEEQIKESFQYLESIRVSVEIGKEETVLEQKPFVPKEEDAPVSDKETTEETGEKVETVEDQTETEKTEDPGNAEENTSGEESDSLEISNEELLASLNTKKVAELKEWANDLSLDTSECKVKQDYIDLIFENIKS